MLTLKDCFAPIAIKPVTDFTKNFWFLAESNGRFEDCSEVNITKYQRHKITSIIHNHHTTIMKIQYYKYWAIFVSCGSRYEDIVLLKMGREK